MATKSLDSRADVYVMALRSLNKRERDAVIIRLLEDPEIRADIIDIATIRKRRNEPSKPFRDYLKTRAVSGR